MNNIRKIHFGYLYVILLIILCSCAGSKPEIGDIQNGVNIQTQSMNLKVQFYDENIVRVMKWLPGSTDEKASLSVIMTELPDIDLKVAKGKNKVTLQSTALKIEVNTKKGNLN